MKNFFLTCYVFVGLGLVLGTCFDSASEGRWWPLAVSAALFIFAFSFIGCRTTGAVRADTVGWIVLLLLALLWGSLSFLDSGTSSLVPLRIGIAVVYAISAIIAMARGTGSAAAVGHP